MKCRKCGKDLDPFDDDTLAEMCWEHSPSNPANANVEKKISYQDIVQRAIHDFVSKSRSHYEKPTILIMHEEFCFELFNEIIGRNMHSYLRYEKGFSNPQYMDYKIIRTMDINKDEVRAY